MDGLFLTSRRHWWEQVNNTVIESHLSVTSGSSQERTRAARFIDRDANNCAISPPPSHDSVMQGNTGIQSSTFIILSFFSLFFSSSSNDHSYISFIFQNINFTLGAVTVDPLTASYDPRPLKGYLAQLGLPYLYEEQGEQSSDIYKK